ncbi:MAG: type II toxin-antitoxin system RelE family toxin [Gemmataceae bacterium]
MPYELMLTPTAERDLERLPEVLLDWVEEHLDRLAANPAAVSRPSVSPPYPPRRMMYQFNRPTPNGIYLVTVLFRYHQDEQRLIILDIGHGETINPAPDDDES